MLRRLFALVSAGSLVLCLATAWLRWHSHRVFVDRAHLALGGAFVCISSADDGLWIEAGTGWPGGAACAAASSSDVRGRMPRPCRRRRSRGRRSPIGRGAASR